jgi:chemotaxis protein MotB
MARRKRGHPEAPHENGERWLLTYSDLITLLFVLFVVMYAISTTDIRKFVALAQSVSAAFNAEVMTGQQPITITDGQDTTEISQTYDQSSSAQATDLRQIEATLEDYAISQGLGAEVQVGTAPQGIVIRLNDALLFSSGRAHLDDKALAVVEKVSAVVRSLPNSIRIEGNTDDQPPDGGLYPDNWELSTARALAVLGAMTQFGISPDRLSASGYAQYNPIVPNTDDASRTKNRRVDVVVLYPQGSGSTPSPSVQPSFQ